MVPGLWIWRVRHPRWHEDEDWEPVVTCTVVESGGERLVLDPLAPPDDATDMWRRLDDRPPTAAIVLAPDHVRDVDIFVERSHIPAWRSRSRSGAPSTTVGSIRSPRTASSWAAHQRPSIAPCGRRPVLFHARTDLCPPARVSANMCLPGWLFAAFDDTWKGSAVLFGVSSLERGEHAAGAMGSSCAHSRCV